MPPKKGRGRGRGAGRGHEQPQAPGPRQEPHPAPRQEPHPAPRQEPHPAPRQEQRQAPPPGYGQERYQPPAHREEQQPQPLLREGRGDGDIPPARQGKGARKKETVVSPEALGIRLEHSLTLSTPLAARPDYGTRGKRIGLLVNYFAVELPHGHVYHYDVEVIPKRRDPEKTAVMPAKTDDKKYRCLSTKRNREVINAMLHACDHFRGLRPAYDGQKNLYTKRPLANAPFKVTVEMDDEPRPSGAAGDPPPRKDTFDVSIKPVQKKETNTCAISLDPLHALFEGKVKEVPQEAVMAVETILRSGPCLAYVPVGRSFFYPPSSPEEMHPLSGGREIWYGYHQSLRLAQWKPMVNINITATTFYQSGPVIKYICDILRCGEDALFRTPQLKDSEIVLLTKELRDLRIQVNHLRYPRKYRILKVTRESANRLEFPMEENGRTIRKRVSDYFTEHYRKLRYPQLPCLQVGPEAKKVFLPLEVCDIIPGQHCKKKMTEMQTSEMIKVTARPPRERFNEIQQIVKRSDFNKDVYNREFGITVSSDPLHLDGRVIEPPNVRYNKDKLIMPRDGSWDMRDSQFFRGAEINSWVFLSYASERFCNRQALDKFARMICSIGRESGINLSQPATIEIFGDGRNVRVDETLQRIQSKFRDVNLAVIVLPDRNASIYGEVKQAAETNLGLVTQCVKAFNVLRKCSPQLVSNLCQKINAKMGGVNNSLTPGQTPAILRKPVIIIGADVTHPSPGSGLKPSIAAAVGSLDAHPSRYAVTCRVQKHTDENKKAIEIILDLKTMVMDLLKAFYRSTNGKKPEKIIFYRDGVSEGQFIQVRDYEIKAVREACKQLSADYEPGITFIVVQKRHHTRFIPRDHREGVGKMKNVPPGTTVDRDVTSSINFDFFLCSHFGLQGTSRPSHYTVLSDDNQFTSDDMQKLTYYLCHTYARCTKSISVPAPVQYAHLAAFRARQHLITQVDESSASSETSLGSPKEIPRSWLDAIIIKPNLKDTMYFV